MSPTDEELLEEIKDLEAEIKKLCAGQDLCDIPKNTKRGAYLDELHAALAEARRCVCQEKLAKWEARRSG